MSLPQNASALPVTAEAFNLGWCIRSSVTANPITGGLTGLQAFISKDRAAFAQTDNDPDENGTTGYGDLDLTADECDCQVLVVKVIASNANAIEWSKEIAFMALDFSAGLEDVNAAVKNLFTKDGEVLTLYESDDETVRWTQTYAVMGDGYQRGRAQE